jgi:hypothetical protein
MPLVLFMVTMVTMFLTKRVEKKITGAFDEKKLGMKGTVLLIAEIVITVSLIVFIPQKIIIIMFLFAYSMLLFVFTYLFSNFSRTIARFFCIIFLLISLTTFFQLVLINNQTLVYGFLAFSGFFCFTFLAFVYEQKNFVTKERWYLSILPSILFILLYIFFSNTNIWFPYMLNLYGLIFAILIILYLGSLFSWKTTVFFSGLLTIIDVILVLFTGTMVSAAQHVSVLRLPILVSFPVFPTIITEGSPLFLSLGLGDLFFAGLLGIQTLKRYGKRFTILINAGMSVSFFIFEILMFNYGLTAFPGTLMIIFGWIPLILIKELIKK